MSSTTLLAVYAAAVATLGMIAVDRPVRVWARLSTGETIRAAEPKPLHPLGIGR